MRNNNIGFNKMSFDQWCAFDSMSGKWTFGSAAWLIWLIENKKRRLIGQEETGRDISQAGAFYRKRHIIDRWDTRGDMRDTHRCKHDSQLWWILVVMVDNYWNPDQNVNNNFLNALIVCHLLSHLSLVLWISYTCPHTFVSSFIIF